ncbi:MAG TPA: VOC family protein [Candidatus Binatia bacterium]
MPIAQTIAPCLWFDDQAEEAARFYVSVFENSRILDVLRYTDAGQEVHGRPPGSVMTVDFELDGQPFTALNGGPAFTFNEAISLQVFCDTQEEIDRYSRALSADGDPNAQQCGWLKDRFGVSWQIVPRELMEMLRSSDVAAARRVMKAMLGMRKLEIAELRRAFEGR